MAGGKSSNASCVFLLDYSSFPFLAGSILNLLRLNWVELEPLTPGFSVQSINHLARTAHIILGLFIYLDTKLTRSP